MRERKSRGEHKTGRPAVIPMTSYPGRWLILAMLLVAPWMIGGLASWAQFGLSVAAVVAATLWFMELAITRPKRIIMPLSVLPILLGVGLGVLQIVPWSPELKERVAAQHSDEQWHAFGDTTPMDQDLISQIELQTDTPVSDLQLPPDLSISIDPNATKMMVVQLWLAALCYVLGAHYFHHFRSLWWLCLILTINGLVVSAFGMVQKMTGDTNELFMGALTVNGSVFGPYVNRNNAAGWLVMTLSAATMLVMYAFNGRGLEDGDSDEDWLLHGQRNQTDVWYGLLRLVHELNARKLAAVFALVFIIGGILTTLSRGGTLAMILGAVIGFVLMGVSSAGRSRQGLQYLAVAITLGLVLVGWLGFGQKLMDRFDQADKSDLMSDARVENWVDTWPLFSQQWLLGSGLDTYQHVHRPLRSTIENSTYVFAENQYFQTLIDAGLLGVVLLAAMLAWTLYQISYLIKRARGPSMVAAGTLGGVALGSQMVSAFFDFGLYLPANTVTFAVLMGAVAGQAQYHGARDQDELPIARWGWGAMSGFLLLVLLGGGLLGSLQYYRMSQVEAALLEAKTLREQAPLASIEDVDASLQVLTDLAANGSEPNLHETLGRQLVLRYRLAEFQRLKQRATAELSEAVVQDLWESTSEAGRSRVIRQMKVVSPQTVPQVQQEFFGAVEAKRWLLTAYAEYLRARRASPLQPELHFRLADLGRLFSEQSVGPHVDRATQIGPNNPRYLMLAGLQKMETIGFDKSNPEFEPAMTQLRTAIELDSTLVRTMEPLLLKKVVLGAAIDGLAAEEYASSLLLDHPELLLDFANRNQELKRQPEVRSQLMVATKERLDRRKQAFTYNVAENWAMGRIEMELENWESAVSYFDKVMQANPSHTGARFQRVLARIQLMEYDKAEEEIRGLLDAQPGNSTYKRVLEQIQQASLSM